MPILVATSFPVFIMIMGCWKDMENRNWIGGETIKNIGKTVLANI